MEPFCASGDTPGVGSGYVYLDCLEGLSPLDTRGYNTGRFTSQGP